MLTDDGIVIFSTNTYYIEKITPKDLDITVKSETTELEHLILSTISYVN